MKTDHVDTILQQWQSERPDLDTSPMEITGRIARISAVLRGEMQNTFQGFGLNHASFDLLATLLRSGSPYTLSPCELLATAMVTSGTMTNRIDRLESAGLVSRTQNPEDKRSCQIALTDKGFQLINEALEAHVTTLHHLTGSLTEENRALLIESLKQLSAALDID